MKNLISNQKIVLWKFYNYEKDILGQGYTGIVYKGLHTESNVEVAIKVIDMKSIDNQIKFYLLNCEVNNL